MTRVEGGADARRQADGTRRARLGELLSGLGVTVDGTRSDAVVTSVEYDSRKVTPGALFVAVRGLTTDGHLYVGEAARRGATAALVDDPTGVPGFLEVVVPDTRVALGLVAHDFYGRPSESLVTHGITGTNGKTTTSYLIDGILREAGLTTGVVGTLGYRVGEEWTNGDMTSPESLDLARMLAAMVDAGVDAVTMEVSSHALALKRNIGTKLNTATFTNISRDHLDFHGSIEDYSAAKRLLFEHIAGDGRKDGSTAIVNVDDAFGRELADYVRSEGKVALVTYGSEQSDVTVVESTSTPSGTHARFSTPAGEVAAELSLISRFNVMNALAATAVAVTQGIPPAAIGAGLSSVKSVEGRLETVDAGQDFTIIVDYAHTPDALAKTLEAVRELTTERVITVFGCGGDRDRGKRPLMGEIAAAGSDMVVVTSDNPRSESPSEIIEQIAAGATSGTGGTVKVLADRREAIRLAVAEANTGDIVLIAGKGHEDYQIVGATKLHFDDREEAEAAVREGADNRGRDGEGAAD